MSREHMDTGRSALIMFASSRNILYRVARQARWCFAVLLWATRSPFSRFSALHEPQLRPMWPPHTLSGYRLLPVIAIYRYAIGIFQSPTQLIFDRNLCRRNKPFCISEKPCAQFRKKITEIAHEILITCIVRTSPYMNTYIHTCM